MASKTSLGIQVFARAYFEPNQSNILMNDFVFGYHILIANQNTFAAQLVSRRWTIVNALGLVKEVEGDGVVGKQPILKPNAIFEYQSGCSLSTDMGTMEGVYHFLNLYTQKMFVVAIPKFYLMPAFKLN